MICGWEMLNAVDLWFHSLWQSFREVICFPATDLFCDLGQDSNSRLNDKAYKRQVEEDRDEIRSYKWRLKHTGRAALR